MGAPFKKVLHPDNVSFKKAAHRLKISSYPHSWVGEADGPTIRGVQEWDILGPSLYFTDTAQLVLGLGGSDAVDDEPALHIVDDAEVLSSLLNLDNIHKPGGELGVGPELAINLDKALLADGFDLLHGEGILQTVPEEESNGERLSLFVGSRAGLDGENSSKFVQHPGGWSC